MSMRYLLVSPNKTGLKMFVESPPIGLGYLATALLRLGHKVDLIDCIIEGWDNHKTFSYIQGTKPDVVGINLFSTALASVKELVGYISNLNPRPMILLGGPHCSGSPEHTLRYFPEADYAFRAKRKYQ